MTDYRKPAPGPQLSPEQIQRYMGHAHALRSEATAAFIARLFGRLRSERRRLGRARAIARKPAGCGRGTPCAA